MENSKAKPTFKILPSNSTNANTFKTFMNDHLELSRYKAVKFGKEKPPQIFIKTVSHKMKEYLIILNQDFTFKVYRIHD